MTDIVIADLSIRRDADGRYCLNDLHTASGGARRHGPSLWLQNQQTCELVEVIAAQGDTGNPVSVVRGGKDQGSYVARELVYAYAMWVSPAFHLKVIRAFDTLVKPSTFAIPQTYAEALRLAADQADLIQQQKALIEEQRPAVEFVDRYVEAKNSLGVRQVAKVMGEKEKPFVAWLIAEQILFRQSGRLLPYAHWQHHGYFEVKTGNNNKHDWAQVKFTPAGVTWIARRRQRNIVSVITSVAKSG